MIAPVETANVPGAAAGSAARLPPFLAACRRQPVPYTPIWIMRQAGRYLPEYRRVRSQAEFTALLRDPALAAEVTLQPLRRFPLDAAILFSDIMTPLQGMGVDLSFEPGPVVREPVRTDAGIDALAPLIPERDVPFVLESIRLVRAGLPPQVPLIGFAGGPFTLLCYLVCGRPSKEFGAARSFLYSSPASAERLLDRLADAMAAYLRAQAAAGAQALMLFESWAGLLAPREFERFALRAVRRTVAALARHRRAPHLLRQSGLGTHGVCRRPRCRCDRRRLALAARRGAAKAGPGEGRAGQPGPGGAVRLAGGSAGARRPSAR